MNTFKPNKRDLEILREIADCRLVTVRQLAAGLEGNLQATRRRIGKLHGQGLIHFRDRAQATGPGRAERLLSLTPAALETLKANHILEQRVTCETVLADRLKAVEHQLLLNWFRVHMQHAERVVESVQTRCWTHNSPFTPRDAAGKLIITDIAGSDDGPGERRARFIPDAVITIADKSRGKTVLFFLEVDCGTEAVISGRESTSDVGGKVRTYCQYFDSGRYRRYEELFNCRLNGFRLLFVCPDHQRQAQLSRLVQSAGGSDFIWLTDATRMFAEGLTGWVWARGGNQEMPPQSIFGSLARRAPLPDVFGV